MAGTRKTSANGTNPGVGVPDEMVEKVGAAVGQVAMIRQEYTERVQTAESDDEKERLAEKAQQAAVKAIGDQGLSVNDYNEVVTAAEGNPELEDRLLTAARAAT